jgi:hypothetical protein
MVSFGCCTWLSVASAVAFDRVVILLDIVVSALERTGIALRGRSAAVEAAECGLDGRTASVGATGSEEMGSMAKVLFVVGISTTGTGGKVADGFDASGCFSLGSAFDATTIR